MVNRFSAKTLTALMLASSLSLVACSETAGPPTSTSATPAAAGTSAAESELRERSAAMQRTVVEAIAVGGLAGTALGLTVGNNRGGNFGVGGYFTFGTVLGGAAGSYVALLQDQYATREDQLERMREDLRANNAETEATLSVMRVVLANQTEELNRLRAAVAGAGGQSADLAREVREAQANLAQMESALQGAQNRRTELSQSRTLIAGDVRDPVADAEIQALSERIAQMREVASSLANQL